MDGGLGIDHGLTNEVPGCGDAAREEETQQRETEVGCLHRTAPQFRMVRGGFCGRTLDLTLFMRLLGFGRFSLAVESTLHAGSGKEMDVKGKGCGKDVGARALRANLNVGKLEVGSLKLQGGGGMKGSPAANAEHGASKIEHPTTKSDKRLRMGAIALCGYRSCVRTTISPPGASWIA